MTRPGSIDTEERRQAAAVQARLAKQLADIHGQKDLSDVGRQRRSARAVVTAQAELAALQQAEVRRVDAREDELTRQLFASTASSSFTGHTDAAQVISARDAADRASRITSPAEAERLLNQADLHNDQVLLRALARECSARGSKLEPGYENLFRQWIDQQPNGADIAAELALIRDEGGDLGHRLSRENAFGTGSLPDYLRGGNLTSLAAGADDVDAEGGTG